MHAERHVACAATVGVADERADDVAPWPTELHLAADGQHAAHVGTGGGTRGTASLHRTFDGEELLAILVFD